MVSPPPKRRVGRNSLGFASSSAFFFSTSAAAAAAVAATAAASSVLRFLSASASAAAAAAAASAAVTSAKSPSPLPLLITVFFLVFSDASAQPSSVTTTSRFVSLSESLVIAREEYGETGRGAQPPPENETSARNPEGMARATEREVSRGEVCLPGRETV